MARTKNFELSLWRLEILANDKMTGWATSSEKYGKRTHGREKENSPNTGAFSGRPVLVKSAGSEYLELISLILSVV